jgi:radical SAM/Cys-rich protein
MPETICNLIPFSQKIQQPLRKKPISVLQINLGYRCNLACSHCHVEASPSRTEELSPQVCEQILQLIKKFPQIKTVDLTGGAPEMLYGFQPIVETAKRLDKEVIVRSNLTIYFELGFEYIPEYCAQNQLRIVASLPCYLVDNVDKMRGSGVYDASIKALQWLNSLGYGQANELVLDLVYNPPIPSSDRFSLTPDQKGLERDYKNFLQEKFGIQFNQLFTITNLPVGRTKFHLQHRKMYEPYLHFLESSFNADTLEYVMCREELSLDYQGNIYDCDFNQMEHLHAQDSSDKKLTIADLLAAKSLDIIAEIQTAVYCYGCTAGSGSSCGGALL